jgi:hypothetical protein
MGRLHGSALLLLVACVLVGCPRYDAHPTADLLANMSVEANGSGSSLVITQLKTGPIQSSSIEMADGDSLVVQVGGNSYPIERHYAAGDTWYQTVIPVDTANVLYRISFLRDRDDEAPNSDVIMPPPLSITAPVPGTAFSRASQALTVTWDGAGAADPLTWQLKGDCILSKLDQQAADTGALTLPAGAIQPRVGMEGSTCTAALHLIRTRGGSVDPAYGLGGELWARQSRVIYFLSTP